MFFLSYKAMLFKINVTENVLYFCPSSLRKF